MSIEGYHELTGVCMFKPQPSTSNVNMIHTSCNQRYLNQFISVTLVLATTPNLFMKVWADTGLVPPLDSLVFPSGAIWSNASCQAQDTSSDNEIVSVMVADESCINGVCYSCAKDSDIRNVIDGNASTIWISQPKLNTPVTIAFDLQGLKEVSSVRIDFGSVYPSAFVIERTQLSPSADSDKDDDNGWIPWQYYAESCGTTFGLLPDVVPTSTNDIVCVSIKQVAGANTPRSIQFNTLASHRPPVPPDRDFRTDHTLQQFTTARGIRIRLVHYNALGVAYDYFGSPISIFNFPFFIVQNIAIKARCLCNGHASSCNATTGVCNCQHATAGDTCATCLTTHRNTPYVLFALMRSIS